MEELTNVANVSYKLLDIPLSAKAQSVLQKVKNVLVFSKTQNSTVGKSGDVIEFTLTVNTPVAITEVVVSDDLETAGYEFVPESVFIDGEPKTSENPTTGISLGDLAKDATKVVKFSAKIK